jgi:hypothetical protein
MQALPGCLRRPSRPPGFARSTDAALLVRLAREANAVSGPDGSGLAVSVESSAGSSARAGAPPVPIDPV